MSNFHKELVTLGYTTIPTNLKPTAIQAICHEYNKVASSENTQTLTPKRFLSIEKLASIIFSKEISKKIKDSINHSYYCMYPDFTMRQNLYIPWHTDTSYMTKEESHFSDELEFVQCSIYFQDNNPDTGGGLEVIPTSHLNVSIDRRNSEHVSTVANQSSSSELIYSKAGDLVLWDSRILHRSVVNKSSNTPKFAIQWTISRTERLTNRYIDFLKQRMQGIKSHISDIANNRERDYVINLSEVQYPNSFSSTLLQKIIENNIKMKTIA